MRKYFNKAFIIFLMLFVFIYCDYNDSNNTSPNNSSEALSILSNSINDGYIGEEYSFVLECKGGTAPYTWQILPYSEQLPDGLTLDSSTGRINGTINEAVLTKTYQLNFQVKDNKGNIATTPSPLSFTISKRYFWTLMFWINGDCNLEEICVHKVKYLQKYNVDTSKICMIAILDRRDSYYTGDGNWTGTKMYKIVYTGSDAAISSDELSCNELNIVSGGDAELNMADGENLSKFISFCKTNYPAKYYYLEMTNHGLSWQGESGIGSKMISSKNFANHAKSFKKKGSKSMGWDDTTGYQDFISNQELVTALSGKSINIVSLESCLMGSIECLYDWRNSADYFIASPESMLAENEKEGSAWQALVDNPYMNPEEFALSFLDSYRTYYDNNTYGYGDDYLTLAVYKMNQIDGVINALKANSSSYISKSSELHQLKITGHLYDAGSEALMDLYDFAEAVNDVTLQTALQNFVIDSYLCGYNDKPYCVSIYFPCFMTPNAFSGYNQIYQSQLPFNNETNWLNFIQSYVANDPLDANYKPNESEIYDSCIVKSYFRDPNSSFLLYYVPDSIKTTLTITQSSSVKHYITVYGIVYQSSYDTVASGYDISCSISTSYDYYYISVSNVNNYGYDYPINLDITLN